MLDCRHRLPCRKLCRNWGHSGVFWIVWQASQCWWVRFMCCCVNFGVILLSSCCLSRFFQTVKYENIYCLACLENCLVLFVINTLSACWHALSHHRPEVLFTLFTLQRNPTVNILGASQSMQVHSDISAFCQQVLPLPFPFTATVSPLPRNQDSFLSATSMKIFLDKSKCILLSSHSMSSSPISIHQ